MELTGQQTLSLPIDRVWAALNDPAILQQCIPGCDVFEETGANHYKIVMTATVGPIRAKFTGKLLLSDITPPSSYKLGFDGSGGAAGSGKGTAAVQLSTVPEGTLLRYTASATVAGRLAQVGSRLIDGVAKKMADQFFARFKSILEPEAPGEAEDAEATPISAGRPAVARSGGRLKWAAAAAAIVAIALGLYLAFN